MHTKVNRSSWNGLESRHNILNSSFTRVNIERRGVVEFVNKGLIPRFENNLSFHREVDWFFDLGNFISNTKMDEVIVIDMHTTQVTQTLNLLGTKTKTIFNIGCDHLRPNMAIIFSVHVLHLWWIGITKGHQKHFEQYVYVECHGQKINNLNCNLVIIKITQLIIGMFCY
jgi:hypothetical protein